jgi:hypothetical protein
MSNRSNKPSIGALSFALRHPELWPEGFSWDFSQCQRCAMGLAHVMWPKHVTAPHLENMVEAFGFNRHDAARIFTTGTSYCRYGLYEPVQPEQVAAALDALVVVDA